MRFSDDRKIEILNESFELNSEEEEDEEYVSRSRAQKFRSFYLTRFKFNLPETRDSEVKFAASKKRHEKEASLFQRARRGIVILLIIYAWIISPILSTRKKTTDLPFLMHFSLICFFFSEIKAFFLGRPARVFLISWKFCIFAFFLSVVCAVLAMMNSSWSGNADYSFVIVNVGKEPKDARTTIDESKTDRQTFLSLSDAVDVSALIYLIGFLVRKTQKKIRR